MPSATMLPGVQQAFEWLDQPWGPALYCKPLSDVARHVFTTRHLELSGLGSWTAVASSVGVAPGRVFRLKQVHGTTIVVVPRGDHTLTLEPPEGDALLTDDPSAALAVRIADCTPILMADRSTGAVGAVHAGWRGTAAAIASKAVDAMIATFKSKPEDLVVAIGPAISKCCYDVGPEVVDVFAASGHPRHLIDRWFLAPPPRRGESERPTLRLDLIAANRDQLVLAGVPEEQIYTSGLCTAIHLDVLTSHRAERERAGRMAAVIRPGHAALTHL